MPSRRPNEVSAMPGVAVRSSLALKNGTQSPGTIVGFVRQAIRRDLKFHIVSSN
jgi:hypothetical protein